MKRYNPGDIEPKWQSIWQETNLYTTDLESNKPKYVAMSMFNYPSGSGIHVGHAMNYTISDVKARFKRQQGFESYHPVGWDSFGLPAENYAIKAGVSPQESMARIIPDYHKQYQAMGWSNDWEKEIATSTPEYYKWTQWIFVKMYEQGLAYQDSRWQWWCTKCQTVLANEQVIDGKCWRHDGKDDPIVEKKEVKQWFFKITEYADELLESTDSLDWTESVKLAQKNWIGRSEGAEITFKIKDSDQEITVFTTRADTLFGATFMVLAPDHELVKEIADPSVMTLVDEYLKATAKKTEVERQASKQKTGVFLGVHAINPINNQEIPIYIADYVLSGYGTGAIMAVPAHDERDYEFARKFDLPIAQVIMTCDDDSTNPPRDEYEEVERETVIVHLQDKSTGKFALLDWHESLEGITTGIMGGVEEGQTPEEAALTEIKEEAALANVVIKRRLRWITAARYCASHKKQNRKAITHVFLAEVDNLESQSTIDDSEKKLHTLIWVDKKDVHQRITPDHQKMVWQQLWHEAPLASEGELMHSGPYDGLSEFEARKKIVADLNQKNLAQIKINYRMRDWSISRQRYWGAPIPVVNCPECGPVVLSEEYLPVVLPELTDFAPSGDGRSALARATDWLQTDCPKCGGKAERETDTMDTYVCSSWYMFRYLDPHNQSKIFDSSTVNKWMPVDFYNGGDHATAHLLYARFITKFFNKIGLCAETEPFKQMLFNGKVTANDGSAFSKTLGNGPDPLEIINSGYGADALRTYLMFAAPLEMGARWDAQGVPGTHRFLSRLWNISQEHLERREPIELSEADASKLLHITHKTIKKVTEDLEANRYNTAIAACMEAVNGLYLLKTSIPFGPNDVWKQSLESLIMCVAPFAPHVAEELWQQFGHSDSVHKDHWPVLDEKFLVGDTMTIVVQVNGKVRAQLSLPIDTTKEQIIEAAKADNHVQEYTDGKELKREVYVPGKIVNLVVS